MGPASRERVKPKDPTRGHYHMDRATSKPDSTLRARQKGQISFMNYFNFPPQHMTELIEKNPPNSP